MMELSLEKPTKPHPLQVEVLSPPPPPEAMSRGGNDIPEDPMESDNYYSHVSQCLLLLN